jgi:hypothetical protein
MDREASKVELIKLGGMIARVGVIRVAHRADPH